MNSLLERLGVDEIEQQALAEIVEEDFRKAVDTRKKQLRAARKRRLRNIEWWR